MSSAARVEKTLTSEEKTLAALLRRLAHTQVPARFAMALQLCAPLAVQCWSWGWHRTAGWLAVASAFGLWGLAQQRLDGYADEVDRPATSIGRRRAWRSLRATAAVIGSTAAVALVLEGFAQIMAGLFGCPGCAG